MNYTTISISDMREQLPDIAERVARTGEMFAVEKWGKIKGYFVPSLDVLKAKDTKNTLLKRRQRLLKETAGIWADRVDWQGKTGAQIVEELRRQEENRYGNIFS